jgi:hypothetical protein
VPSADRLQLLHKAISLLRHLIEFVRLPVKQPVDVDNLEVPTFLRKRGR